jgi:hypothetical protein
MSQRLDTRPRRRMLRDRAARLLAAGLGRRRAAVLPAIAAGVGLLVALPGLFRIEAPPVTVVPPGDAALVNGRPVLQSDFVAQVEAETSMPFDQVPLPRRAQVLHDMIDEELMVQRSLALDLPENDVDVRQALVVGLEAQINAPVLAERITDDRLRAYYNAHRADYATDGTMRIRNIVLHVGGYRNADQSISQATEDATEAAYQLRAGAAIDAVMAHYGFVDAPKADPGDQFDFAAKLHLGDALYALAQTMNSGDVSDPVTQPDGVHLLVMADRRPPQVTGFERVRASVYTAYRQDQQKRNEAANLGLLRRSALILIAPGAAE